jgi:malonyl-CoA/methylmalonyl-CoA synthetase
VSWWRAHPDQEVIVDQDGPSVTGADLLDRTRLAAARLAGAGLRPGDRVLVSGAGSVDLVVAHVAALRSGLVVVPVNPAYTRRELEVIIGDARPGAAIIDRAEVRDWVATIDPTLPVTDVDLGSFLPGADPELDVAGADDPALLPYTSGTTGTPKGALLSHGNLLASAEALVTAWRWTSDDRLILCLPLFHMHGLGVGLHGSLLAGASIVLQPSFDPERVLAAAAGSGATLFFGVPTMYSRLVEAPGADRLRSLRLCVSGSAPMSAELHEQVRQACGHEVLERYGMTETAMNTGNPLDGVRKPGSVGLPFEGVELRLQHEEVQLRGPNVFAGYWRNEAATREAFTPDGWFRTGDLGRLDEDGYLFLTGRARELIITGGLNVYPREVEEALLALPGVVEAAVLGLPDADFGERVVAAIVGPADVHELRRALASRLAAFKVPKEIHVVEALPKNAMGKVQKPLLAERLRPSRG